MTCEFIRNHQPVWIQGTTGIGKTYLCSKLRNQAHSLHYTVDYHKTPDFFRRCAEAQKKGLSKYFLSDISRTNLIIFDEFLNTGITFSEAVFLNELLEYPVDPEQPRSIVISSLRTEEDIEQILTDAAPSLSESIIGHLKTNRLLFKITVSDKKGFKQVVVKIKEN